MKMWKGTANCWYCPCVCIDLQLPSSAVLIVDSKSIRLLGQHKCRYSQCMNAWNHQSFPFLPYLVDWSLRPQSSNVPQGVVMLVLHNQVTGRRLRHESISPVWWLFLGSSGDDMSIVRPSFGVSRDMPGVAIAGMDYRARFTRRRCCVAPREYFWRDKDHVESTWSASSRRTWSCMEEKIEPIAEAL